MISAPARICRASATKRLLSADSSASVCPRCSFVTSSKHHIGQNTPKLDAFQLLSETFRDKPKEPRAVDRKNLWGPKSKTGGYAGHRAEQGRSAVDEHFPRAFGKEKVSPLRISGPRTSYSHSDGHKKSTTKPRDPWQPHVDRPRAEPRQSFSKKAPQFSGDRAAPLSDRQGARDSGNMHPSASEFSVELDSADTASEHRKDRRGKGKERDLEKRQRLLEKKQSSTAEALRAEKRRERETAARKPQDVYLQDGISVVNLSSIIGVNYDSLARKMKQLGLEQTDANHVLNAEMASLIVLEYGMNPIVFASPDYDITALPEPTDWSLHPSRSPVVTIMGHVDHGKTTLLDALRKTSVAATEAGGITQHIGAFSVVVPSGKRMTFLDTPGHAAFSAMRQRGAKTTDIVVLVVAADDGVMPQTVEAIKHAMAAGVPIIVAINKCDKPQKDLKRVKEGLLQHDVVLEEYGGDVPAVEVSALTGKGLDELEENIVTLAEVMDIRGDATGAPEGAVIESKIVRGRGIVATVLVKRGTVQPGSILVSGNTWCKVRMMHDENSKMVREAGPSVPVEIMGWKDVPAAGEQVLGISKSNLNATLAEWCTRRYSNLSGRELRDSEREELAKMIVESRLEKAKRLQAAGNIEQLNEQRKRDKADVPADNEKPEEIKELVQNILLKADVHGSAEALEDAIRGLPSHEARINVVSTGVGGITESDVDLAAAANAKIIAFNVPSDKRIQSVAKAKGVDVRSHQIIYKLLDELKEMLSDLLPPEIIHEVSGEAEILQVFRINVKGKQTEPIAGCRITTGKVLRNNHIRIIRAGSAVHEGGSLKTFKHHKKDILEAGKGLECGMAFDTFNDFQEGDVIQSYTVIEKKRKIT
ncbi:hypothetical protein HDU85_005450 [Gaertneriomyces sp. JEL0708]|nr:hypothetical protein HDU85_005450 [Gaertneriomyces sp. JEL0708]